MTTIVILVAFAAGLIVGWNFFPQPKMVRDFIMRIVG